ncbi:hypothetical protein Ahy_A04g017586 [Arachis hypogaea]|uniref:Uncharacterized protein n=1 Tax=Arachis hypogaea TaxID=3818 RepID=A0A445DBI9_ARAHY|nr:hypothetical protein Ahy_A04g017586 [Arachis hypogaea]
MIPQLNLKYCVVGMMMMNGVVYAVLMVQLLAWTSGAVVVASGKCIESERQALLSLKRGFNATDDDWLSSWGDGDHQKECCNWEGVKCSNHTGHVVMLDLHADDYTLRSIISPSLSELYHLKYLDLSGNSFTLTTSIPPFIGSLTILTHLDLSFCSFAGKIPPQLGNLLFLEYVDLRANHFEDPQQIPSQFSNLSHLVYLDLSFNYLVGGFPLQVTNMSSLTYLDLSHNELNGTMPPQLGNLLSLEHLDLSANAFTGTIPSQFKNISPLQYLDLDSWDNTMSVSSDLQWLPELSILSYLSLGRVNLSGASNWQQQVSSLSHLQYLDLNGCNLVDSMPTSSLASPANFSTSLSYVDISYNSLRDASFIFPWLMNSTRSLVTLRMNHNGLTGTIPETLWDKLSSLEELNIANNELKGQIPLSLFHSCNLAYLDLSNNNLTGEFHEYIREYSRCAQKPLRILDMGWNEITGMVPDLSQLQSLEQLRLGNNRLNGSIHEGIGQLSNLNELSLGNNFLTGLITEAHFSRLSNLDTLDLSHNALAFNVSVDWIPPFNLTIIYLASCKLGPNFPTWLHTQTKIEYLDISCAGISSTVPNWFWEPLPHMFYFNISHNRFRGKIEDPNLPAIEYRLSIDLSFNLFEGPIPAFLSTASHIFLSNNRFSIANPLLCANSTESMGFMDLSNNNLRGELSDCWRGFELLVVLDLSNNQFYGNMPKSLGSLRNIQSIHFEGNDFSGKIPSSLHNCTQLQVFDVAGNKLSGAIPSWIGDNIPKLLVLSLHSNHFHGNIPLSMCNLANNEFKGQILVSLFHSCNLANLDLSNNKLTGEFHEYIGEFSRCAHKPLQILDLGRNEITGMMPDLSHLSSLQELHLDNNRLNGTIHEGIGQLSNLFALSLGNNLFHGLISEAHFSRLSNLHSLDLSHNALVFNLSAKWVPPFNLIFVNLASCNLGFNFPRWLQTQVNIEQLDISQAQISSVVPNWFWEGFSTIWDLNLSHNQFRGKIEGQIPANNLEIQTIDLSFNLFEGPIQAFLSTASLLFLSNNGFSTINPLLCANSSKDTRLMDLSNNYLGGELPDCWMDFEFLVILDLSDNHFYGKMPRSLGSLKHVQSIHFGGNNFSGEIPSSLNNCTKLLVFDAAYNQLSGIIPSWIGDNIPKLLVLNLYSNKFHGSIPLSICNLHELRVLDLSLNILSGNIPTCISDLSAMATLANSNATIAHDYYYTGLYSTSDHIIGSEHVFVKVYNDSTSLIWKGKMSTYRSILGLLRSIDFSSNRLTGEIPTKMMSLIGLVSLNLSRNLFSGHIPPTIGQLKSIDFLDLSRNHLSGRIPSQLAQIDRLSVLDLSYNALSGEIPLGTQLQTRDASAYAGNPKLCGPPLNKTCTIHGHQISEHDADGDDEQFVSEGFYIAMAVGFVMAFWGVCFSLILKKSWRDAYFKLLSDVYDKIYVFTVIRVAKLKRIRSQV